MSERPGIPGDAVAWALKRLPPGTRKKDLQGLAKAMRGMAAADVIDALANWTKRTGLGLRLDHVHLLLGYLRDFGCKTVLEAMNAAFDEAPGLGHTVATPRYLELRLLQLANDPARREARAGGD